MEDHVLKELIEKYLAEKATPEEEAALLNWYFSADLSEIVIPLKDQAELDGIRASMRDRVMAHAKHNQQPSLPDQPTIQEAPTTPVKHIRRGWWAAAAAVVIVLGAAYLWTNNRSDRSLATTKSSKSLQTDIAPGGEKAVLTLADGTTIVLDNAANGNLAQQGGAQIVKLANGEIAYDLKGLEQEEVMMNTMSTPRGGQYQLKLPDGTRVWLNAASSITYPAVFAGAKRNVKITGEVFFEVAKNKEKPFIVDIDGRSTVQVLGTSFNINAYTDESGIKTTLFEGSVKVIRSHATAAILKPGQQSIVSSDDQQLKIVDANIEEVMAWKEGYFQFNEASLSTVLRQLSRWYDVDVVYEGNVPSKQFIGEIPRDATLSQVLKVLERTGVHFTIDGKRIIVRP